MSQVGKPKERINIQPVEEPVPAKEPVPLPVPEKEPVEANA